MANEWSESTFYGMVQHVFLPRKLSKEFDPSENVIYENNLLALLADVVKGAQEYLPASTNSLFGRMYNVQRSFDSASIVDAIKTLSPGEMLGLYIREQNAGFCLYLPCEGDSGRGILSTFPASLSSELILNSPNEVQVSLPL